MDAWWRWVSGEWRLLGSLPRGWLRTRGRVGGTDDARGAPEEPRGALALALALTISTNSQARSSFKICNVYVVLRMHMHAPNEVSRAMSTQHVIMCECRVHRCLQAPSAVSFKPKVSCGAEKYTLIMTDLDAPDRSGRIGAQRVCALQFVHYVVSDISAESLAAGGALEGTTVLDYLGVGAQLGWKYKARRGNRGCLYAPGVKTNCWYLYFPGISQDSPPPVFEARLTVRTTVRACTCQPRCALQVRPASLRVPALQPDSGQQARGPGGRVRGTWREDCTLCGQGSGLGSTFSGKTAFCGWPVCP